ncbi:unnamed protein product [Phytophthora lilii]|uniref:Unnamed protein product n=1 Tax=Phytophthora lilii TaxID=2077276 RepID=A0A9W6TCX9_9STRA|nr:unnamed protein product [Phytophthora lilii]
MSSDRRGGRCNVPRRRPSEARRRGAIQVSNVEVLDGISRGDVKRIAKWDEIEVGDMVKVKEQGSRLYYEAEVVARKENGTYKVHFAEVDEDEDNVAADRVVKLMSGRLEDKEWMMYKETEQE